VDDVQPSQRLVCLNPERLSAVDLNSICDYVRANAGYSEDGSQSVQIWWETQSVTTRKADMVITFGRDLQILSVLLDRVPGVKPITDVERDRILDLVKEAVGSLRKERRRGSPYFG